jgi:anaerobic magnesium-protoporphyrin IX monomethyl ester cyclase
MKVALLFPPLTQARLFPYGSLPALAGYLGSKGYDVVCHDINLELTKALCSDESISSYRCGLSLSQESLSNQVRHAFLDYFSANKSVIRNSIWGNGDRLTILDSGISPSRMIENLVDAIAEKSMLRAKIVDFKDFDLILDQFKLEECDLTTSTLTDLVSKIDFRDITVVGISVPFFSQLLPSLLISKLVKSIKPTIKILWGGPQVFLRSQDLMNVRHVRDYVDALCPERGEDPLLSYLQHLEKQFCADDIAGLYLLNTAEPTFRPSEPIPMSNLPPPDFGDFKLTHYLSEEVQIGITTCYGCYWGRCAFCSYGNRTLMGDTYDQYTPEKLASICLEIKQKTGIDRINFVDENTNLRLVEQASTIVRQAGMNLRFSTRNRLEPVLLRKEFVKRLKNNGLVLMSAGYETNQQVLLDRIDKGLRASTFQKIIDNLHEVGIPLRLSIMSGLPGETVEMAQDSIEFLKLNEKKIGIDITQVLIAEPNTFLVNNPEHYGLAKSSGLRGNDLLNFGQGRVGTNYALADTISFKAAESILVDLHRRIAPQKNDERLPNKDFTHRGKYLDQLQQNEKTTFGLHEWISILIDLNRNMRFLYDNAWQNILWLGEDVTLINRTLHFESRCQSQDTINKLLKFNMVRVG